MVNTIIFQERTQKFSKGLSTKVEKADNIFINNIFLKLLLDNWISGS